MDTKTQIIENELFHTKEELANWLRLYNGTRRNGNVNVEKRKELKEEHIPHLMKIIMEIDRRGFKTFRAKHLKGRLLTNSDTHDRLSEYDFGKVAYYLHELVGQDIIKIRNHKTRAKGKVYERNFDTVEEAMSDIYEGLR